jgi:hypothetical protein
MPPTPTSTEKTGVIQQREVVMAARSPILAVFEDELLVFMILMIFDVLVPDSSK